MTQIENVYTKCMIYILIYKGPDIGRMTPWNAIQGSVIVPAADYNN